MLTNQECTPYLAHLRTEHRRLHALLGDARAAVQQFQTQDENAVTSLLQTLQQIRRELARHFSEEEQGSCLEEAVARCPRLSDEVKRVQAEHNVLLENVDCLIARGKTVADAQAEVQRGFEDLCHQLYAHEAAESRVLETGFGECINE
jgi:ferredoxin